MGLIRYYEPDQFTLISMGLIRYSCGHISGHYEPIHVKFGVWGFFIMFYWNIVMKMLKCKKENLMTSHFSTLWKSVIADVSFTFMKCSHYIFQSLYFYGTSLFMELFIMFVRGSTQALTLSDWLPNIFFFRPHLAMNCRFIFATLSVSMAALFSLHRTFNGSQLAKLKKYIPHMPLPWNV